MEDGYVLCIGVVMYCGWRIAMSCVLVWSCIVDGGWFCLVYWCGHVLWMDDGFCLVYW